MDLVGQDGARVVLRPEGYQYADATSGWDDANWLVIAGTVEGPEGAWSFRDPCLQTVEARALGAFLIAVSRGSVPAQPPGQDAWPDWVALEPNLGVAVETYEGDAVTLRLHFALESAPPWSPDGYRLRCTLARADVARAAETWLGELARFPERGTEPDRPC